MNKQEITSLNEVEQSHEYEIDEKRVFIVTPVYREDGKTIFDALLNLISKHE